MPEQNEMNVQEKRKLGLFANLKEVVLGGNADARNSVTEELKGEAVSVIGAIQHMLDGHNLDDGTTQKLSAIIAKIKSALEKGTLARGTLATALSEAKAAVSNGAEKSISEKQKTDQLWQRVEADNNAINDDFEKMRRAGINFSDGLWNRHKELTEYMQTHPRDIAKQKELDAVDDVLIHQAKPQLKQYPGAHPYFDDAQKKSEDRHQTVDNDLAKINTRKSQNLSAFDEDDSKMSKHPKNLNMDDVSMQLVGQRPKSTSKQLD